MFQDYDRSANGRKGVTSSSVRLGRGIFKLWLKRAMIGSLSIYNCGRPLLCPDCNRTASPPFIIRPSKPSKSTVTHQRRTDRVSFLTWSFLGSISYGYLLEVPNSSLSMPKLMCYPTPCVTCPAVAKASRRDRHALRYGGPLCVLPRIQ